MPGVGNWGLRVLSGIVCGLVDTEHLSGRWTGDESSGEACGSVVEWLLNNKNNKLFVNVGQDIAY